MKEGNANLDIFKKSTKIVFQAMTISVTNFYQAILKIFLGLTNPINLSML